MPEKEKGIKANKKYGPLTAKTWALVGVGVGAAYIIYHKLKSGSASSSGATPFLAGGTTIPSPTASSGTSSGTTSTAATTGFSTYADWASAAISSLTTSGLNPADAYNAIQNWVNGVCLSQSQYNALGSFLSSSGLPPGYGSSTPPLTVCASSTPVAAVSTPVATPISTAQPNSAPALPSSLAAAMTANGEHIVSTAWDPVYKDWTFLTQKGGIYNLNASGGQGGGFLGSIFTLNGPGHAGWFSSSGAQQRTAQQLIINPNGGYTVVDTAGETYNFQPGGGLGN